MKATYKDNLLAAAILAAVALSVIQAAFAQQPERQRGLAIEPYEQCQQDDQAQEQPQPLSLDDSGWFSFTPVESVDEDEPPSTIEYGQPFLLCADITLEDTAAQPTTAPTDGRPAPAHAASDSEALAKKLANPVANLISVPIQSNFNLGGGFDMPGGGRPRLLRQLHSLFGARGPRGLLRRESNHRLDFGRPGRNGRLVERALGLGTRGDDRNQAFRYLLNVQPVVPFTLSKDWNLISRTIVPVVAQNDVIGSTSQGGLGDTTQSLFLSPSATEPFIWGAGPVFLLPTATDHNLLGAHRWGIGPTGVLLKQTGPWTVGVLANHIWSFARDDGRKEVNSTYLQPFLTYTFKTATSLSLNTESTYDWIDHQWNVPLFAGVGQVVKLGPMPVNFQLGGQYWVEGPDSAPDWSIRFQITFLFPK